MPNRLILIVLLLAAADGYAQQNLRPEVPVAVVGGMLLDGNEAEPIHHSVILFENGRITAVGNRDDTPIPEQAVLIDAGVDVFQHVGSAGNPPYEAALVAEIAHRNIPAAVLFL